MNRHNSLDPNATPTWQETLIKTYENVNSDNDDDDDDDDTVENDMNTD